MVRDQIPLQDMSLEIKSNNSAKVSAHQLTSFPTVLVHSGVFIDKRGVKSTLSQGLAGRETRIARH